MMKLHLQIHKNITVITFTNVRVHTLLSISLQVIVMDKEQGLIYYEHLYLMCKRN